MPTVVDTFTASGTWTAPGGVTSVTVEVWGGGGGASNRAVTNPCGGGGGGAYSIKVLTVVPTTGYAITVGAGGTPGNAGGDTHFIDAATVMAKGGGSGTGSVGNTGGASASGVGDTKYSGGNGGNGSSGSGTGGGGGSSAGTAANGNNGAGRTAGTAPTGGGAGGIGSASGASNGANGSAPGGGGGGQGDTGGSFNGAVGKVTVTYTAATLLLSGTSVSGLNSPITTTGIDTTGANLIVVGISMFTVATATSGVLTDSKGNTYTILSVYDSGASVQITGYYCLAPTVGSGHTFTYTNTTGSGVIAATLMVQAFSGAAASSVLDQQTGATTTGGTSLAAGSITPSQNNEIITSIFGATKDGTAYSVDSSMTITSNVQFVSGDHQGGAMAYKIQTTAAAINPTWSYPTDIFGYAASVQSWKTAAPATSSFVRNSATTHRPNLARR